MTIKRQAAVLFASDLPATIKYWNEKPGFATHGTFLDLPVFAIMERDHHFVMLKRAESGQVIQPYWQPNDGL